MVRLLLSVFQLLHCRLILNYTTGVHRMVISRGSFTFFPKKSLIEYLPISKMCNDGPSYRVGEASRTSPKGLARLPNIYNLERYQVSTFNNFKKMGNICKSVTHSIKEQLTAESSRRIWR